MENIGSMRPLGWPTMNARGGGSLFSGGRTRAVGHGATPGGADFRLTNRRVELEGVGARRVDAAAQPPQRVLGPAKCDTSLQGGGPVPVSGFGIAMTTFRI